MEQLVKQQWKESNEWSLINVDQLTERMFQFTLKVHLADPRGNLVLLGGVHQAKKAVKTGILQNDGRNTFGFSEFVGLKSIFFT